MGGSALGRGLDLLEEAECQTHTKYPNCCYGKQSQNLEIPKAHQTSDTTILKALRRYVNVQRTEGIVVYSNTGNLSFVCREESQL